MSIIAVTGATGQVGRQLVRELRAKGAGVRAIGRSAERLRHAADLGAEPRVGSMDDVGFLTKAFSGADAVFTMIPPDYTQPEYRSHQHGVGERLAQGVAASKVSRVVSLSSIGADLYDTNGPIGGLHDLEQSLNAISGLHVLHLRPTYFMENHLHGVGLIKGKQIYGTPIKADHPFPMVATRDIASAAAGALTGGAFTGHSFRELLGPRDYSMRETAKVVGAAVGIPDLPYVEFPYDATRDALLGMGFSSDVARLFIEMYDGFNTGRIHSLQGRNAETNTATTLEQFAKETFAPAFQQ